MSDSRIRVFWDVVDFPFPKCLAPETIYHTMKSILEKLGFGGDLSIMAYVDTQSLVPDKSVYDKAGITIITHQRERDRFMLLDLAWWEVDMREIRFKRESKACMMVISKKIKKESIFLTFLENMPFSNCYKVLLAIPQDPPSPHLQTISFDFLYASLLNEVEPLYDSPVTTMPSSSPALVNSEEPLYSSHVYTPPMPKETSSSLVVESMSPEGCPCVFLDIMEPLLCNPDIIRPYMKCLLGFDGEFSIMAYVDTKTIPDEFVDAYKKAGITVIPANINARAQMLLVDIVLWATENPATYFQPRTLLVVSDYVKEGTDFFNALEALSDRYYNVYLSRDFRSFFPTPRPLFLIKGPNISKAKSIGFSNGLATLYNEYVDYSQIHIFLDVHGCPTELSCILQVLRKKGYRGEVRFRPYLDMDCEDGPSDYGDDYACVPSIRVGDKSAIVTRMLLDILFWAMNNDDQPKNLMLITQPSKHTNCAFVLQALERRGFNVIFKPSDKVASINPHTIDTFEPLCKNPPDELTLKHWRYLRKLTDQTRKLRLYPIVVYWLVDNCPSNPKEFRNRFHSTLMDKGYFDCVSVMAYIDKGKISDELIEVYSKAGVEVELVLEDHKYGKITHMSLDMIHRTYDGPFNFMVISKPFEDALFDNVVGAIKGRGCNVLFDTEDYMLTFGSSFWSAKSILNGSSSDSVGRSSPQAA